MATRLETLALAAGLLLALPALAQPAAPSEWQAPRTQWGDPDLRGEWPLDNIARTPRERPLAMGTRATLTDAEYEAALAIAEEELRLGDEQDRVGILGMGHWAERGRPLRQTSLIVEPANGRYPPLTEAGRAAQAQMRTSWNNEVFNWVDDFGIFDRCLTRGMPASMLPGNYNSGIAVHQAPGLVAIRLEMIHETRMVWLDGREPPPAEVTFALGWSRGHWEGETLVIETSHFTPGLSNGPAPNSDQMRMRERLTPTGPNTIRYEAWVEDPVMLSAPYKLDFPWTRNPAYRQFEYACHEGNVAIRDYIRATGSRFAEWRAARVAAREAEGGRAP